MQRLTRIPLRTPNKILGRVQLAKVLWVKGGFKWDKQFKFQGSTEGSREEQNVPRKEENISWSFDNDVAWKCNQFFLVRILALRRSVLEVFLPGLWKVCVGSAGHTEPLNPVGSLESCPPRLCTPRCWTSCADWGRSFERGNAVSGTWNWERWSRCYMPQL